MEDGGADASLSELVTLPAPPMVPSFTPCPDGWREVADGRGTYCHPYSESGRQSCPAGQAHFVGEPGCSPAGDPCPAGDFPDGLPADTPTLFVRAGAAGGVGSASSPFGTIAAALSRASRGTVIALGPGRYDWIGTVSAGVTLWGTCAAETIISPSGTSNETGTVRSGGSGVVLRNLTISPNARPGVQLLGAGAGILLDGVAILGAVGAGIHVQDGAQLEGTSVVVENTRGHIGSGGFGYGLNVVVGDVSMSRVSFDGNRTAATVLAFAGTDVRLQDIAVVETQPSEADGLAGRGLDAQQEAAVLVERAFVDSNHDVGVLVSGATSVTASDLVVSNTRSRPSDGSSGRGISVGSASTVEGSRLVSITNRESGLVRFGASTLARLEDAIVVDTEDSDSIDPDYGVPLGRAMTVQDQARLELARGLLGRNRDGLVVVDATASLTDLEVRETTGHDSDADGVVAAGIFGADGSSITGQRILMEDNRGVGVASIVGAEAALEDLVVRDMRARVSDGAFGRALTARASASVSLRRAILERSWEFGVLFVDGATGVLEDLAVLGTEPSPCADGGCSFEPAGVGVAGFLPGTSIRITRFLISDSALCGVMVGPSSSVDLTTGEVRRAEIGACVADAGYDVSRLSADVAYRDNGTNLDSTSLPVPLSVDTVPELL